MARTTVQADKAKATRVLVEQAPVVVCPGCEVQVMGEFEVVATVVGLIDALPEEGGPPQVEVDTQLRQVKFSHTCAPTRPTNPEPNQ